MNNLQRLLMTKEQPWANRSRWSFKKSNISDLLVIQANRSQKRASRLKKFRYCVVFPLFMPKSKSHQSLSPSFLKSNREQITPVVLYKRATGVIALFHKWIDLFLFGSQKMSKLLKKPMSEFPTLPLGHGVKCTYQELQEAEGRRRKSKEWRTGTGRILLHCIS